MTMYLKSAWDRSVRISVKRRVESHTSNVISPSPRPSACLRTLDEAHHSSSAAESDGGSKSYAVMKEQGTC